MSSPPKLVVIVSWGPDQCGLAGYLAVYTKVSAVWGWIIYACNLQKIPMVITKAGAMP
jgi:secreted trypsin-like serine protease